MPSIAAYNTIERYPALYGQGLAMQLLTEALDLGQMEDRLEGQGHQECLKRQGRQECLGGQEDQGLQEHPECQGGSATSGAIRGMTVKDNAEAAGGGVDQRQRLIHKMAGLESRYDSAICMLRSPFSSPGYHTTLKQAEFIHSTRDSLSYALGLLDTELARYEERAFDIIRQVISLQDTDPAHDTFGIWSWFYEEPLDQMAPPDWNWADFCGSRLVQALSRHGHRFQDDLREAAVLSIECACEAIIRRNVGPDYTNIAIIGAFVTRIAGEKLGRKDYADYGLERLRKLHAHTLKHGAFSGI
ncbi:hypothetical protein ACFTAO_49900 [Paenibacillus rhizoplanae]